MKRAVRYNRSEIDMISAISDQISIATKLDCVIAVTAIFTVPLNCFVADIYEMNRIEASINTNYYGRSEME